MKKHESKEIIHEETESQSRPDAHSLCLPLLWKTESTSPTGFQYGLQPGEQEEVEELEKVSSLISFLNNQPFIWWENAKLLLLMLHLSSDTQFGVSNSTETQFGPDPARPNPLSEQSASAGLSPASGPGGSSVEVQWRTENQREGSAQGPDKPAMPGFTNGQMHKCLRLIYRVKNEQLWNLLKVKCIATTIMLNRHQIQKNLNMTSMHDFLDLLKIDQMTIWLFNRVKIINMTNSYVYHLFCRLCFLTISL